MAYTTTTLSSACLITDTSIVVASATSIAAKNILVIDQERFQVGNGYTTGTTIPVLRGREGTVTAAHASGAGVANGIGAVDYGSTPPQLNVDYQYVRGDMNSVDVTATGATGSTATLLPQHCPCLVTITGVSGAGVAIPTGAAVPGAMYIFKNMTTGVAKIYAVGGTINGTTGTTAISVTATGNIGGIVICTVAGAWQVTPTPT